MCELVHTFRSERTLSQWRLSDCMSEPKTSSTSGPESDGQRMGKEDFEETMQLERQRTKFMTEPLSTSLFVGAPSRHLKAGEALLVAGTPGEGCYRLEQGLLKVVVTSSWGEQRILAMLGPGQIVGELAIIDGYSRCASVFAVRDCELSFISRAAFEERAIRHP